MPNSRLLALRPCARLALLAGMLVMATTAFAVEPPPESLDASRKPIGMKRVGDDEDQKPEVTVLSPNTAVLWPMGGLRRIEWRASDDGGVQSIDLELSIDDGGHWLPIAGGLPDTGHYDWKLPNLNTGLARVRVTARDAGSKTAADVNDVAFEIRDKLKPTMTVTTPRGGQIWGTGDYKRLTWKATDNWGVAKVDLAYSADGGTSWIPIAENLPNSGGYWWTIPATPVTESALVKATATDSAGWVTTDTSDSLFRIRDMTAPAVALTTPAGGEAWAAGSEQSLAWSATDNVGVTAIDLLWSADAGVTWNPIVIGAANSGGLAWTVPLTLTADARMWLVAHDAAGWLASDTSAFIIFDPPPPPPPPADTTAPVVAVIAPNGGESWETGSAQTITWLATDDRGVAAIDVAWSADGGATWSSLSDAMPNDGTLAWTVPDQPTVLALVRVTARDSAGNAASDSGDAVFALASPPPPPPADTTAPAVTLIAPNGGEVWPADSARVILWSASDDVGVHSVDLEYSEDGGTTWTTIAAAIPDSGNHSWTEPLAPSTMARLRVVVRDAAGNLGSDASDADFELRAAAPPPPPPADSLPYKVISLHADRADGTGSYAIPGAASPWVDLAGDHDATVAGFNGTAAAGWVGDGTLGNPHRLEFGGEESGWNNRVVIPGGSVPQLQSIGSLTASVWFKTGMDGPNPRYEYVLEWVQQPTPDMNPEYEGRGMSIVVQNGTIQVYANPWVDVGPAAPNTWYHVAVVKDTNDLRVYVNGEPRHAGIKSHRGIQESEIALGASIFRRFEGREGDAAFSDWFRGAVGQFELWQGTLTDSAVLASFRVDSAIYLTPAPTPGDSAVVRLDASRADGFGPPVVPGAGTPWVDLAGAADNFDLVGFEGDAISGWAGDGSPESPYRLEFDGENDAVAIGVGQPVELNAPGVEAITLDMTFRTGSNIASSTFRYLAEWLHAFGASPGLSLAVSESKLKVYAGFFQWTDIATLAADTWYRVTVVKGAGQIRIHLDGAEVYQGVEPNFGLPNSGIAIGASLWRGAGQYGEFWNGAISGLTLWPRALSSVEILSPLDRRAVDPERAVLANAVETVQTLALAGAWPNPARGAFQVRFSLPNSAPARLELLDVSGRRIEAREVGALGAGRHVVSMGEGKREPGVYWIRLAQSGRAIVSRVAVVE